MPGAIYDMEVTEALALIAVMAFDLAFPVSATAAEREASRKIDRERREAADERWRKVEAARANAELKR